MLIFDSMNGYILMLEDDHDDRYFTESTMAEIGLDIPIEFELFSKDLLVNISLNNPRLIILGYHTHAGVAILQKIRAVDSLKKIPVVVLCEDISSSQIQDYYKAGANSVIKKPSTVNGTREKIQTFFSYWLHVAEI